MRNLLALIVFTFFSLLPALQAAGQAVGDTLQEVRVKGKHNRSSDTRINDFAPGQKVISIDTATLQQYQLQSMATMLAQQVPVFVKSYGFNGLATLNFRGSSAAQSQVLWNGIPIQNASLGIADVSTLPVMLMSKVNIVYGGSAAMWGSGNVGGALMIENDAPVFDSGRHTLTVSGGAGSFGQYMDGLQGTVSGKKWYGSASVMMQGAQNDFTYRDAYGAEQKMPNNQLKSTAVLLQGARKLSNYSTLSLAGWYQDYIREIPPALFESFSDRKQEDRAIRIMGSWNRQTEGNLWYAKSAIIRDEVQFGGSQILYNRSNVAWQYYQEAGWKKQWGQWGQLLVFMPIQLAWVETTTGHKQQNKMALAAAYNIKLLNSNLDVAVNARGERINDLAVLLPGINAAYNLTPWLAIRGNVQRTYRTPTLNELYYEPGGNIRLKPEQGWTADGGYTVKARKGKITLYHDLSVFDRVIHDWVIWLGGAIWTPHNISEVHSRGVETENRVSWDLGNWKAHIGVNTAYALATTVNSFIDNDFSNGKQIPYTPRYNGQANIGLEYKRFSFNYNHTYTGYRFITTDESEYLEPYQTGNVQLMYNMQIRAHLLQLTAQCNNIWNAQYQVVGFRPMPGTNWLAGLKLGIF